MWTYPFACYHSWPYSFDTMSDEIMPPPRFSSLNTFQTFYESCMQHWQKSRVRRRPRTASVSAGRLAQNGFLEWDLTLPGGVPAPDHVPGSGVSCFQAYTCLHSSLPRGKSQTSRTTLCLFFSAWCFSRGRQCIGNE